jgi:hypothetical protein
MKAFNALAGELHCFQGASSVPFDGCSRFHSLYD